MKKLSIVVNADTRPKSLLPQSSILDSQGGCSCTDFMTHGVRNKINYFRDYPIHEVILFIDIQEPIPDSVMNDLNLLIAEYPFVKPTFFKYVPHEMGQLWQCKKYDMVYLEALCMATGDYIAHFDGDMGAFRTDNCKIIDRYFKWLDNNEYDFISLPMFGSPNAGNEDREYWWASTRFFICKKERIDRDEIIRCFDNSYIKQKYGVNCWPNCLEHILGCQVGNGRVLYPPEEFFNGDFTNDTGFSPFKECGYMIFSWATYHRKTMQKLNSTSYEEVYDYIIKTCGGIHGANDVIGKEIV